MPDDEMYMREAIVQAQKAKALGEAPVGAVLVLDGRVLAATHNLRETNKDPTAHAEILAIRAAARAIGDWRLTGATVYVTLEPCAMCAGAIVAARVDRVVFGAYDRQAGCAGSVYRITEDPAFSHFAQADGGVLEDACARLFDGVWVREKA